MEAALYLSRRKDWRAAFTALWRLLSDTSDTTQVFRIMRALNTGIMKTNYEKLLRTPEGGRIAYQHVELATLFSDRDVTGRFPEGSVGAAYAAFLENTGYSAKGLAMVSQAENAMLESEHPYAWFGRRTRDIHDIWHILTGYRADEPLDEACLVAFSYPQTGGLGWAFIAIATALKATRSPHGKLAVRAIREGYRRGCAATWLLGEDYERLLAEPLDAARARLGISPAVAYDALRQAIGASL